MFQQYDKAVQTVLDYLVEQSYSETPCKDFRRTTREFRKYLEERNLCRRPHYCPSRICGVVQDMPA